MKPTTIYIASDHRGFRLKEAFGQKLREMGLTLHDLGPEGEARCDASRFAVKLAEALQKDATARGILICGSGQAMAMTANRYKHLRAALCANATVTRLAREHNDANVLVLGADIIGVAVAQDCLDAFLATEFHGGRYAERRDYLTGLGGI